MAVVWLVPFGKHSFIDGAIAVERGVTIASSTKMPWTVLFAVLVSTFFAGRAIAVRIRKQLKIALIAWWVVGPAFVLFLVLRDPAFDWSRIWSVDVPIAAAFALGGGAVLYVLARPGREDLARVLSAAGGFCTLALGGRLRGLVWNAQKVRISFVLLAIAVLLVPRSPRAKGPLRLSGGWIGLMVVLHWMITAINTPSTLVISAPPFIGGWCSPSRSRTT